MNRKFIMVMCKFIYIKKAYICIEKMYTEKRKIKIAKIILIVRKRKFIMKKKSVHRYFIFPNFEIMIFTIISFLKINFRFSLWIMKNKISYLHVLVFNSWGPLKGFHCSLLWGLWIFYAWIRINCTCQSWFVKYLFVFHYGNYFEWEIRFGSKLKPMKVTYYPIEPGIKIIPFVV